MIGCIKVPHGHISGTARAVSRVVLSAMLLAGCSSVPDAVNPVEWYKGASDFITGKDDKPATASKSAGSDLKPLEAKAEPRKEPAKGLVADRGNAKYAEPVRREVTPTKQLARRQAPAADAAQAQPAGAATVAKAELAPPAGQSQQVAQARDTGPDQPVAMNNTPPARPDIPETVGGTKIKPVIAHFQKRLAESAATSIQPGMVDGGFGRRTAFDDEPIHLIPPSARKTAKRGGGKGMAAPEPQAPAASFQVAAVDFRGGSSDLTAADRAAIAQAAKLYRESRGGIIRIVGLAPAYSADSLGDIMGGFDASLKRANAVARELTRRGVPAGKIMVGADPSGGATENVGAKVFLDVI